MTAAAQKPRPTLGSALKSIRTERRWSLAETSAVTGLSISTLSKIETGQRSLTFDKLHQLAESLGVDIARLFSETGAEPSPALHAGRRSVHRPGDGFVLDAGVYGYTFMADDLVRKRFSPVLMELRARSLDAFDGLHKHGGDEFAFVIEGEVEVLSEIYKPLRLKVGEGVYFDSNVGHAYLNAGEGAATILTIASDAIPPGKAATPVVARPSQKPG